MIERLSALICIASAIVFTTARLAAAEAIKPVPVIGNIQWIYSYEEGQKIARESGKPIFVVFRCER